ncbi:MAG: hypothetical protein GTO18_00510 [Anaerolineales bacterium]|nr:hypothetical protein [Anaerolineales bacterium]
MSPQPYSVSQLVFIWGLLSPAIHKNKLTHTRAATKRT